MEVDIVRIQILSRMTKGTCDLTRKEGLEVWSIQTSGGEVTRVCTQRLPEVLRILASVAEPETNESATDETATR